MPSTSEKQRAFIFAKRSKYKTKKDTPDKWKWVWSKDWETIQENRMKKYKPLIEDITIPINIGDTIRHGKFKNKLAIVSDIKINDKGDYIIVTDKGLEIPLLKIRLK